MCPVTFVLWRCAPCKILFLDDAYIPMTIFPGWMILIICNIHPSVMWRDSKILKVHLFVPLQYVWREYGNDDCTTMYRTYKVLCIQFVIKESNSSTVYLHTDSLTKELLNYRKSKSLGSTFKTVLHFLKSSVLKRLFMRLKHLKILETKKCKWTTKIRE